MVEVARGFASLGDSDASHAFVQTMRAVLDVGGQRVSAMDRLYLADAMPSLLVWGENDPIIPVEHGEAAHDAMPGSRFEILARTGHFPQVERPREFAGILRDFVETTEAADVDVADIREQLLERAGGELISPSIK